MRYFVLMLILFSWHSQILADDQPTENSKLIANLSSRSQETRDAAAKKLREVYIPPKRNKWTMFLASIKAGDTKEKIFQQFGPDRPKVQVGVGTGQVHMEEYRLDDRWVLSAWFNNADNTLREFKLVERIRNVWAKPPDGFSGVWVTYHVNGQRSHEIHYKNGKYFGTFTAYHSNGSPSYVQNYGPNGIDGKDTGFFPTGKVMYRAFYKTGSPVGTWTWYNKDGSVRTTKRH